MSVLIKGMEMPTSCHECGLSDEMNVALGYGGRLVVEIPKEE